MGQIENGTATLPARVGIDRQTANTLSVNPTRGLVVESLSQAMELAKLMAISGQAVPKHLRDNAGACLAIAVQGYEWGINPFALANKSYVVNDRLAYESALYHAVVQRRAPIKGRIKQAYSGDGQNRKCRVWAVLDDGSGDVVEYISPPTGTIKPKNSPSWINDPDQQLFYFSVRAFARRHFPDVMMGIATVDEIIDAPPLVDSTAKSGNDRLAGKLGITNRPVSENQQFVPDADAQEQVAAQDSHAGDTIDADTGVVTTTENPEATDRKTEADVDRANQEIPPCPNHLNHAKWLESMQSAAQELGGGMVPSVFARLLEEGVAAAGGDKKIKPADRQRLWTELHTLTGAFAWAETAEKQ